jgi:hypothetical protein
VVGAGDDDALDLVGFGVAVGDRGHDLVTDLRAAPPMAPIRTDLPNEPAEQAPF